MEEAATATRSSKKKKNGQPAPKARTIPCSDPATGESLGEVAVMSPDEVRAAVERARHAQAEWAQTTFAERRRVLNLLLQAILQDADELCEVICRDAGKTRENAMIGEVWPICEKLRWTIKHGEDALRPERVSPGILLHKRARIVYEPLGVMGIICPWNFPLQNIVGPVVPALMAGNACVVKVSEWTSWSAPIFQKLFDRVLDAAGHSRDLVQIITGYAETGAALVSAGVDKVFFTGSLPNGRRVIRESADTCTPVVLELGGKDAFIVCDDAPLEAAVYTALSGTFIASGQMCLAAERIYVFESIYDRFVERVVEVASQLRQGPPLGPERVDVGAMTMPGQVEIVERLVKDAVAKGAKVRVGGHRGEGGQFFAPTVLTDVDHTMDIMRHETFGPVMAIVKVRDEEEAIRLANDSEYGLSSSVFTKSSARARRIASQLRAGSTVINDFALNYMVQALPFGGVGGSGFGRLNGREGLRACTNVKSVVEDFVPTRAPVKLFPVGEHDYDLTREVIRVVYGGSLRSRARSAARLGKTLVRQLLPRSKRS